MGLWHKLFSPDQVWQAAHVDEDYQISQWGEDEEAAERRVKRRVEFDTAVDPFCAAASDWRATCAERVASSDTVFIDFAMASTD